MIEICQDSRMTRGPITTPPCLASLPRHYTIPLFPERTIVQLSNRDIGVPKISKSGAKAISRSGRSSRGIMEWSTTIVTTAADLILMEMNLLGIRKRRLLQPAASLA